MPGGLQTVGYDDEGAKSVPSDIIRDGMLVGFEMSRDTARAIGRADQRLRARAELGARADDPHVQPDACCPARCRSRRCSRTSRDGIYMEANRSWSIDDHRLNFQFGCQIGWEIKNGRRGRMVKNPTYAGMTPRFWNACDAIADQRSWVAWGTPNCGKGEPMQRGRTSHGCSPARFRKIQVGVGYAR